MQSLIGGVLVVLGLILASGVLTLAEFALGSARKSRLRDWSSRGDRGAEMALRLGNDPQGFLSAVQAGMTLLSTLAGVYGGAILGPELGRAIEQFLPLAPYRDAISLSVVVLGITLATLVLAELVPRRIALHRPEPIARLVSRPIRAMAILAKPLVGFLSAATDRALRVVGVRPTPELPITEEKPVRQESPCLLAQAGRVILNSA